LAKTLKVLLVGAVSLTGLTLGSTTIASAAGGYESDYEMVHKHWHFKGMRGTYDRAAAQRGYQVYREVCSSCHALEQLAFRHLGDKGAPFYNEDYPNPNDNPLVKAFIVSARNGGADYLYNLMIAYEAPIPDDVKLTPGLYYNPVMEGGKIAMKAPLSDGLVDYAPTQMKVDGEMQTVPAPEATVDQMAADLTEFLAWSSDPKLEQRKQAGFATMLYLLILSVLLWFSYQPLVLLVARGFMILTALRIQNG